jgi:hypothetical protein
MHLTLQAQKETVLFLLAEVLVLVVEAQPKQVAGVMDAAESLVSAHPTNFHVLVACGRWVAIFMILSIFTVALDFSNFCLSVCFQIWIFSFLFSLSHFRLFTTAMATGNSCEGMLARLLPALAPSLASPSTCVRAETLRLLAQLPQDHFLVQC